MIKKNDLITYIHAKQREIRILSSIRTKNIKYNRMQYTSIVNHINNFLKNDTEYYNRCIMMPGLRGVGKTTILYQLYNYLITEKDIDNKDILYLDLYDLKSTYDSNIKEVFELYLEDIQETTLVNLNKKIFLFIDETQLDDKWAIYAKLLFDKSFNVFCIFTGSSALNFEVNTDASRRLTREQVFPCNFQEYLLLKHDLNLSENNFKDLILKRTETSIKNAIECEKIMNTKLYELNNTPEIELKKFIHYQGFPYALNLNEINTHLITNNMVGKIVNNDLKSFGSFNDDMDDIILRIISYLATKKPGETSASAISQSADISIKTVNKILNTLEKAQLIFKVNAYGSAGKMLKKPSEYFFLSPSIKSAINYRVGRYDLNHHKCYSVLIENNIASSLYRLSFETTPSMAIFYDSAKKGVDFIVKHLDTVIPIEVGIGKKTKSQLTKAMHRYSADYGILISSRTSQIRYENNILYIPLVTSALI